MIGWRVSLALILLLIMIRAVVAGLLPLSADEAYYWLWSKHLAAGYFDHPPAIAWLIRAGTLPFGDTPFGVRFAGLVLSLPASWFVWRAGADILKDEDRAALAALLFNLTLMVSVELLAATPDMPSLVTSAAFLWCLARLRATGQGIFWLAAGMAGGFGLLAKFSMLFLGAGALFWLLADNSVRYWLKTCWPWLGAGLALAIFSPNLFWQSRHHWETFAFQFGRVGGGHLTGRFLAEFIAAQFALATPLIFVLMAVGLWRGRRPSSATFLPAILASVGLIYFLAHALHDRVQGNWPCFLYPALAILAADVFVPGAGGVADPRANGFWRRLSMIAAPLAGLFLLAAYAQALFSPLVLRRDPVARLLGRDFAPIAEVASAMVKAHLADAILTTDYETTAWLRFTQPGLKVIQIGEPQRYPDAPEPSPGLIQERLAYLTEFRRDQHQLVQRDFAYMGFPTQLQTRSSLYMVYPVGRPKSSQIGKMP